MFFGTSCFKKSNVSPQVKPDSDKQPMVSPSIRKNALWDALCDSDLNSSSDLDDSMDYFYSKPDIFSNKSNNYDNKSKLSTNQNWKTKFFKHESAKETIKPTNKTTLSQLGIEINNQDPRINSNFQKFQPLQSKAGSIQRFCSFGKSPLTQSPSTPIYRSEKDFSKEDISLDEYSNKENLPDLDSGIGSNTVVVQNENFATHLKETGLKQSLETEKTPTPSDCFEKLPFLHLKLKNEALKLEKWKDDLMNKLKKNEHDLLESNLLVESLRKSNLELQMDRENTGLKLKDEIEQRGLLENRVLSTRQLCEALKTQIELVGSTCSSTIQTNFKTKTVQKALENLLQSGLEDVKELSVELKECKQNNKELLVEKKTLENKLTEEFKLWSKEREDLTEKILKNQDELLDYKSNVQNETSIICGQLDNLKLTFITYNEELTINSDLLESMEETIKHLEFQHKAACVATEDTETRLQAAVKRCSQLTEDLKQMYGLLQMSKANNVDKTNKINTLESKVAEIEKDKLNLIENASRVEQEHIILFETFNSQLQIVASKSSDIFPSLIMMVNENNDLLKAYECSERNMIEQISSLKLSLETSEDNKTEFEKHLCDLKHQISVKDEFIEELKTVGKCESELNEKLKLEIERISKDLIDSNKACMSLQSSHSELINYQKKSELEIEALQSIEQELKNNILKKSNDATHQETKINELLNTIKKLEEKLKQSQKKISESGRCIDLKNDQIVDLEKQVTEKQISIQNLEKKVELSIQEADQIEGIMKDNRACLAKKNLEIDQLKNQLQSTEAERMAAVKQNGEIRSELLYAMEQQQQEMDKLLRQKDEEIKKIKISIVSQKTDVDKNIKKNEKKISESTLQLEKLTKQLKEQALEKKDFAKQTLAKNQQILKIEKELELKNKKVNERDENIKDLKEQLHDMCEERDKTLYTLKLKDEELQRLNKLAVEYKSYRNQIMYNSPPPSTQIPIEVKLNGCQTPKSPFLSQNMSFLNILKTPKKTPKGILKQPGSECKRRRVLLLSPDKEFNFDPTVDSSKISNEPLNEFSENRANTRTPKSRATPIEINQVHPQLKNVNIRKTPGSGPRGPSKQIYQHQEAVSGASWFDSDQTFGITVED